uniref:Uncharacterized protein n=1 Tax=Arundo donax TaxID=35708 RepID=A0A0A8ZMM5_ARUDO
MSFSFRHSNSTSSNVLSACTYSLYYCAYS